MKNRSKILIAILPVLACFALLPGAQAVSPAPDGCYSNFTTAEGCNALNFLTTGSGNTGLGWFALSSDSTGSFNTAVGGGALDLSNGDSNTAVGAAALLLNTTGSQNTAVGTDALVFNTNGSDNTAIGWFALITNTTGGVNTAIGAEALSSNATGFNNIALGFAAGDSLTTGDDNIDIGNEGVAAEAGTIRIGTDGTQTRTFIAGISGGVVSGSGVVVNASGQLGVAASSARFKDEIKPMDKASEAIFALKPVTFRYKKEIDPDRTPEFGLVAEEVEKVSPDLVARDEQGKPYTVRYEAVNAMLLNEFLKEHREVQQQKATIIQLKSALAQQKKDFRAVAARQQEQIEALTAGLQKVSAELEVSKLAPQTIANNQ